MTDYAAIRKALTEYEARQARKAAAAKVADAIQRYKPHPEIYYMLNVEAGIPVTGGPTPHQIALRELLHEVSNGVQS